MLTRERTPSPKIIKVARTSHVRSKNSLSQSISNFPRTPVSMNFFKYRTITLLLGGCPSIEFTIHGRVLTAIIKTNRAIASFIPYADVIDATSRLSYDDAVWWSQSSITHIAYFSS